MSNLYASDILYWAKDERFRGALENPSASARRENLSCGDALTCSLKLALTPALSQDRERGAKLIERVRFEGVGCVICLASATVLAEHVEKMTVEAALALSKQNMVEWLSCDVGPMRTNCMMLALLTLRDALCSQSLK